MKRKLITFLQLIALCCVIQILPVNATQNNNQEFIEENAEEDMEDEEIDEEDVDEDEEEDNDSSEPLVDITEDVEEENISETDPVNSETKEIEKDIKEGEYNTTGKATIKSGNGYVTFVGHVNPEIQENIYISFFNMKTYDEYAYYVYQINDYKTSVELPAGDYFLGEGGVPTDVMCNYPIENVQFTVVPNQAIVVDFGVGMAKNQIGVYGGESDIVTISLEGEENTQNEEVEAIQSISANEIEPEKKENKIWGIVKNTLFMVVFIVLGMLIYRKIKAKEEDD